MGLTLLFSKSFFLVLKGNLWLNIRKLTCFHIYLKKCVSVVMCRNMWRINSKRLLEYFLHHFKIWGDNSSLFRGEYHGNLVFISYPRYMRDMCEDLKGLYFVIKGNGLREKWICNYEMVILSSRLSCIKESALSSWGFN